ncbi:MAG: SRPBCC domain-containing protein [Bacteroidota bacterium]
MRDFKKYYIIPAPPEDVYVALTNETTIQLWTGDVAEMKAEPGSEFSMWDGSIVGKILELEEGKKIVQQWHFGEEEAEPSVVTLKLHKDKNGTSLELKHTNIPDEAYEDIVEGWNETYMAGLIDFYEED